VGFERAVAEARTAERRGDAPATERWCRAAIELLDGELLPEEGLSEWVVARREACRAAGVEVASRLAGLLLERGDGAGAASICAWGLELDRYHDPLWRLLIRARETTGDHGAASVARAGYRRALADIGVEVPAGSLA
jgi:DNA-binding SARP family transcriptional activator